MLDTIKLLFILIGACTYSASAEVNLTDQGMEPRDNDTGIRSIGQLSIIRKNTSNSVINNFTNGMENETPISMLIITKMPLFSYQDNNYHNHDHNLGGTDSIQTANQTVSLGSKQIIQSDPANNERISNANKTTSRIDENSYPANNKRVTKDISHWSSKTHHRDRRKLFDTEKKKIPSSSVISTSSDDISFTMQNDAFNNNNQNWPQQQPQPVYEVLINEEEKDLPKKLFQVKALMINDSNKTRTSNGREPPWQDNHGLMFILSGTGVDYEHPEQSKFAINAFTGELFLISPLDRDPPNGRDLYQLLISAEDESSEKINGSVLVLVRVRDINDNAPYFPNPQYMAQVSENLAAGIDVIRVVAVDPDSDSIVRYSIEVNRVNSDGELIFDIDELSGLVSTAVCCLDRESIDQYTIKICATDRAINGDHQAYHWSNNINNNNNNNNNRPGQQPQLSSSNFLLNQSSCTNVVINVTDENDEPPRFVRQKFYLSLAQGVNELYPQRTLLNTSVVDNDLPETNRFVCRLDVKLWFPLQVPPEIHLDQNGTNESLFWRFILNGTTNGSSSNSSSFLHWNGSSSGHHANLSKYFQCHINIYGNVRVQTSDTFPRKHFHQIMMQEFLHFRTGLWNRFLLKFGSMFPASILRVYEDQLKQPSYAELIIKIMVSDLGYFEVSQRPLGAVSNHKASQQQQQQIYDIVGLLESHVISGELQIRLSTEPFVGNDPADKSDQQSGNGNGDIIINKQRVLPYDSQNDVVIDESLKRSREASKHDHSDLIRLDTSDYANGNSNNLRFGPRKLFQSILGKFFSSMQLNSIWLLLILIGCCLLIMVSLVFLYMTRTKRKRRELTNLSYEDVSDGVGSDMDHHEMHSTSTMPMLLAQQNGQSFQSSSTAVIYDAYKNPQQLQSQPSSSSSTSLQRQFCYSQVSEQVCAPITNTAVTLSSIDKVQPLNDICYYNESHQASPHLVLLDDKSTATASTATANHQQQYDYALYDLAQISAGNVASSDRLSHRSSSLAVDLPKAGGTEEMEMQSMVISQASQYYNNNKCIEQQFNPINRSTPSSTAKVVSMHQSNRQYAA